jgi:hypothetical protein
MGLVTICDAATVVNVTVGSSSGYIYDLVLLKEMVDFPQGKSTTFGEIYRECRIFSGGRQSKKILGAFSKVSLQK